MMFSRTSVGITAPVSILFSARMNGKGAQGGCFFPNSVIAIPPLAPFSTTGLSRPVRIHTKVVYARMCVNLN